MSDSASQEKPAASGQVEDQVEIPRVHWRVRVGDKVYGPYPRAKLLEFLQEGRVAAHTMLSCGADDIFHRAEDHPNLRWDFTQKARGFHEKRLDAGEDAPSVCNYFVCARLLMGHEPFERALNQAGKFARAGSGMWVLRSNVTLPQLRNKLSVTLRKDEQFVVVNATKGRLAWFNLGAEHDVAVRSVWNADLKT